MFKKWFLFEKIHILSKKNSQIQLFTILKWYKISLYNLINHRYNIFKAQKILQYYTVSRLEIL